DVGEGGLARGELGLQSQSLFPLPAQPGALDVLDPTRLVHVFERGAQVRQIVLLAQTLGQGVVELLGTGYAQQGLDRAPQPRLRDLLHRRVDRERGVEVVGGPLVVVLGAVEPHRRGQGQLPPVGLDLAAEDDGQSRAQSLLQPVLVEEGDLHRLLTVVDDDLGDGSLPLLHPAGADLDHLGLDDRGLPQRQIAQTRALTGHEVASWEEPEQVGHRVHPALGEVLPVGRPEVVFEPGRHSTPMMTSTPGSLESKSWKWTLSWDFAIHSCSSSRTSGAQSGPWTTVSSSPPAPSSRSASFSTRVVSS